MKHWKVIGLLGAGLLSTQAGAVDLTFSGFLDDPANAALIGSYPWLDDATPDPALFTPVDIPYNVALYEFTVSTPGTVTFDSNGYDSGGQDPYVSLFQGTGGAATFLQSFMGAVIGDFSETTSLGVGLYTVAIGIFENMSFAENAGIGALRDGFIGLPNDDLSRTYYYELVVKLPDGVTPVPEPSTWLLTMVGLLALGSMRPRSYARGR